MSIRLTDEDIAGFIATPRLSAALQRVLADLIELHLQGKQAHWNVVGPTFRSLHLQLDEIVTLARDGADTVAERMRALAAVPDGRSDTVAATTSLPAYPAGEKPTSEVVRLITSRLHATTATIRAVRDDVDAEDPATSDILHGLLDGLEKQAWMLAAAA